jgi:hypothetical protein
MRGPIAVRRAAPVNSSAPPVPFLLALARTALMLLAASLSAVATVSCGDGPTAPSASAVATFQVGSESFRVLLKTDSQIRGAEIARAGGQARIPIGRIVAGTEVNAGWTWHLEDVTFVEVTIELCDGIPSDVERAGTAFGNGQYCPWSARVTNITTVD